MTHKSCSRAGANTVSAVVNSLYRYVGKFLISTFICRQYSTVIHATDIKEDYIAYQSNSRIHRREHRQRINTEEKAKVVAAVLWDRIYSIPCRASCFALEQCKD